MKNFRYYLYILVKGILAGLCIGIGGWLYIKARSTALTSITAAFLFPIGLILICNFGFFLYTGKICYLPMQMKEKNGLSYGIQLVLGLIGNYVGATLMGVIISHTLEVPLFVNEMVNTKLDYEWWKLIVLAIFCGLLIYFAVEAFAKLENIFGKYIVLIFCVAGFIICGFEHCIADMFYFALANQFSLQVIIATILIIIGNSIGGLLVPLIRRIFNE